MARIRPLKIKNTNAIDIVKVLSEYQMPNSGVFIKHFKVGKGLYITVHINDFNDTIQYVEIIDDVPFAYSNFGDFFERLPKEVKKKLAFNLDLFKRIHK